MESHDYTVSSSDIQFADANGIEISDLEKIINSFEKIQGKMRE